MRYSLRLVGCLLLLGSCQKPTQPPKDPTTKPETTAPAQGRLVEGGFPVPSDAVDEGAAPGGGGSILLYGVPRNREAVATELRGLLTSNGFTIDSDEVSPKGAIRLAATKDGKTYKASIQGDDTQSKIILTLHKPRFQW